MIFVRKTWKDRMVEFAGRRMLTKVSGSADGQMVVDVARQEGNVSQTGDAFSAENMNDLEERISDAFGIFDSKTIVIPASGWSSSAPYSNTVSVPGITESDDADMTYRPTEGATNAQNIASYESYASINYANTGDGTMTFYAMDEKPKSNITVAIKGIKG